MKRTRSLNAGWNLQRLAAPSTAPEMQGSIAAGVPGVVHLDLLAAGLIADPYLDVNEISQDWVGRSGWRYALDFDWDDNGASIHQLVCDGLDTVADIRLNGALIGQSRNMNRSYRFDISRHLKPGSNRLEIDFLSVFDYGEDVRRQMGLAADIPANYPGPWPLVRKMACNFGWDWGPTLVTSGPWKPIRIESWSSSRLVSVRPKVTVEGRHGLVEVDVVIERPAGERPDLTLVMTIAGQIVKLPLVDGDETAHLECRVEDPRVWWPHGLGDQPLYDLDIALLDPSGQSVDNWQRRVGFRSARLDTSEDDRGSAFTIIINDVPVFIRGANWIPDDCFLPRVTPERYRERISQARDANINLLRVWGGGIYETDAFYEACDEAGILVWQDFLFACAAYPEEEPLFSEVEAEAREAIERLMPHPSLVLWNGNNENIWGYFDWGWKQVLGDRPWGAGYYFDLLPKLVAEIDPTRAYWPGSPYSGSMNLAPNLPERGCMHIWDVWNEVGYVTYRNYVPRFCSEFGWQAPPSFATMKAAMREDKPGPTSPGVYHHQKATLGNEKLIKGLRGWFPEPGSFENWHFVTQLNQARAISVGIEHMRSHRPDCMGTIVWQLNDCWPVTSWSAIDGAGRKKPLWYALKHSYVQQLLTIQPRESGLAAIAANDTTLFWRVPFSVERLDIDGNVLASHSVWRILCDRFQNATIELPDKIAIPGNPIREFIRARLGRCEAWWFFERDEAFAYPEPRHQHTVARTESGYDVTITAKTLLRDLCLLVDKADPGAEVDDMLVTLLPGESRTFHVSFRLGPIPEAFSMSPDMIMTANHVARR